MLIAAKKHHSPAAASAPEDLSSPLGRDVSAPPLETRPDSRRLQLVSQGALAAILLIFPFCLGGAATVPRLVVQLTVFTLTAAWLLFAPGQCALALAGNGAARIILGGLGFGGWGSMACGVFGAWFFVLIQNTVYYFFTFLNQFFH